MAKRIFVEKYPRFQVEAGSLKKEFNEKDFLLNKKENV